jgi:alanine-glyoxylate transaminase/serine-glyoxylate transaminase/serine-pyruvate transaminase
MLTSVRLPEGIDDQAFRAHLRRFHRLEVGGGLGPLAGKVFRVGLMGHGARLENVLRALAAFGDALAAAGRGADIGTALGRARLTHG